MTTRYPDHNIVAIIPCYNTARHIGEVVKKTLPHVDRVIVVDDGSKDATAQLAEEAGATVVNHNNNLGKGSAMKTGVNNAKEATIVVFMDGDGQHNPAEISLLLKPILEDNADFVLGSRYLVKSNAITPPFMRRLTNFIASVIISAVVSTPLTPKYNRTTIVKNRLSSNGNYKALNGKLKWFTDCTGGFRVLRTQSFNKLNLTANGYQIETEMIYEAVKNGLSIAEAPTTCSWKGSVSTLSIARDGAKTITMLGKKILRR
jgi:glycosyltransferase involved in cell wall biosynthesis